MKKNYLFIAIIGLALFITGCKKNDDNQTTKPDDPSQDDPTYVEPPVDDYVSNFGDGSFENGWQPISLEGKDFTDYSSTLLSTINSLYALPASLGASGPLTCIPDGNPVEGHKCMKLTTGMITGLNILIPGAVGTISPNYIGEFLGGGAINLKKEFEGKPVMMKGYFKYAPVEGDSAGIEIAVYNDNTVLGYANWIQHDPQSKWTLFEIPIAYTDNSSIPTDIKIVISSSAGYDFDNLVNCKGNVGSTLYIDRVWFKY